MSQPDPTDDGRYKSRGRKERTPEQLEVLEMAREKARLVIAERTKIKREMTEPPTEPEPAEPEETEPPTPPPEPEPPAVEDSDPELEPAPEPEPEPPAPPPPPPAEQVSLSRDEIQSLIHSALDERRAPARKYAFVDGMYVQIK